jgi:hypothetical protein
MVKLYSTVYERFFVVFVLHLSMNECIYTSLTGFARLRAELVAIRALQVLSYQKYDTGNKFRCRIFGADDRT